MAQDIIIKPAFKDLIIRGFQSPVSFVKEILEHDLHEGQEECLMNMRLKSHIGITCGNRWGKGDLVAYYSAWLGAYKPVSDYIKTKKIGILNTSISQDQANIVFDKFIDSFQDRPKFSWLIKDIKKSPFPVIEFKNGIKWWFRNASQDGKFLEGRSYLYANFDEADLQKNFEKFINEILWPRLWDYGGYLSWTTTPRRGKKNAYKVWDYINKKIKTGDNSFYSYRGDSRDNKFLHPTAIERMNKLPQRLKNKNVLGIYDDSDGQISNDALDYCELISAGAGLLEKPEPGAKYINVWDLARSSTFNVGLTIELSNPIQLRSWERTQESKVSKNRKYWELIKKRIRDRHSKWGGVTVLDATGLGDVVASDLSDINPVSIKYSATLKRQIIDEGLSMIELGQIGLPLPEINQILNNEYWCLRDELTDFDESALDVIVWDFVCALFTGMWYSQGKRPSKTKVKKLKKIRCLPIAKGMNKNAMAL